MENKTKTDWTISRENINPKTKQPYKRGRNWGIVVYPESLPKNWKEIIGFLNQNHTLNDKYIKNSKKEIYYVKKINLDGSILVKKEENDFTI